MNRRTVKFACALAVFAALLVVPASAQALSLRQGQNIVIGKGEVVNDDVLGAASEPLGAGLGMLRPDTWPDTVGVMVSG